MHSRLREYFETHYSANRMKVSLLGSQTLEELEAIARASFSAIPNKHAAFAPWPSEILTARQKGMRCVLEPHAHARTHTHTHTQPHTHTHTNARTHARARARRYNVVPVKEDRTLSLYFFLPSMRPYYRNQPLDFLLNIIGTDAHDGYE